MPRQLSIPEAVKEVVAELGLDCELPPWHACEAARAQLGLGAAPRKTPLGRSLAQVIEKMGRHANRVLADLGIDQTVNTGIVTYYPGKLPGKTPSVSKNGLGYHTDASPNLAKKTAIVAFTFGEARPLRIRDNKTKKVTSVVPEHGDAYVMLPGTQETETHCVPNGHEERWSVTFRTVV